MITRAEIENMPAGREMDALVAVEIFGWRWMKYPAPNARDMVLTGIFPPRSICSIESPNEYQRIWQPSDAAAPRFAPWDDPIWWDLDGTMQRGLPHYSTDISAAWLVIKALNKGMFRLELGARIASAEFSGYSKKKTTVHGVPEDVAPLAICRAALLALLPQAGGYHD